MIGDHTARPPALRLELINGFRLLLDDQEVQIPRQGQRVVAYLGLRTKAPRDEIAGTLWPGSTEQHAHGSLRSALWRVHRQCAGLVLPIGGQLAMHAVGSDVEDWERAVRSTSWLPEQPFVILPGSSGILLPGWYDDWVLLERERLRQLQLHGLEAVALLRLQRQDYAAALEAALRAVAMEPLRESARRLVVRIHLAEGNLGEALHEYNTFARLLEAELGVRPTPVLRALFAAEPVTPG